MKTVLITIFLILFLLTECFPFGTITLGKENFKRKSFSIDIYPLGYCTGWDDDSHRWKAISVGYSENVSKYIYALYGKGGSELWLQTFAGIGPEFNLSGKSELGLKTKFALSLFIVPINITLTPRYNFNNNTFNISFQAEVGIGFLIPIYVPNHKTCPAD